MSRPTGIVVGVGVERGLGAALCRRFAVEGYHVLVAGRTPEKIAQVASTICQTGGSAEPVSVDNTRGKMSSISSSEPWRPAMDAIRPTLSSLMRATISASISAI